MVPARIETLKVNASRDLAETPLTLLSRSDFSSHAPTLRRSSRTSNADQDTSMARDGESSRRILMSDVRQTCLDRRIP